MSQRARPNLIIKQIEEGKESRLKNIYLFILSLNAEQEKYFNRGLKKLINNVGGEAQLNQEEEETE